MSNKMIWGLVLIALFALFTACENKTTKTEDAEASTNGNITQQAVSNDEVLANGNTTQQAGSINKNFNQSSDSSGMISTTVACITQQEIWQENSVKFINDIKDEAYSKGWGKIAASGAIADSDSLVFYVMGSAVIEDLPVTMLIYVSFNRESPRGKLNQIRYFFQGNSDLSYDILATNDKELVDFFSNLLSNPSEVNTNSNAGITSASSAEGKAQQAIWQENSVEYINNIKADLVSKGWEKIVVSNANESADSLRYIVTGQTDGMYDNAITMIANFVFNNESPEGKLDTVVYISEAEREMDSDKLLSANDKDLFDVMYSY